MSTPWHPGLIIADRYRLEVHIGTGGAADVWRAFDSLLEASIAIKLLDPQYADSEVARRFLREARAAAQLRSLHVVQILDHGLHGTMPYITMELLEGETLADRIDREQRLSPAALCHLFGHIAKAASRAHDAGITHRDLKPSNVFIVHGDEPDEEIAKVFDFGIAKLSKPLGGAPKTSTTSAGTLLGTPAYMSPEQARGEAIDHLTDIYAMGILAFEALTGTLPFLSGEMADILQSAADGELIRASAVASVPPGFDAWFEKATAFVPKDRFPSAKELASSLRSCLVS